jgi:hypothetical protein
MSFIMHIVIALFFYPVFVHNCFHDYGSGLPSIIGFPFVEDILTLNSLSLAREY